MATEAESGRGGEDIDDLVARYIDRLNAGESIDPLGIISEHPDSGPEIIERLEGFVSLGGGQGSLVPASLGTIGDYTLRRQIGRGGMGVVYEAWENSMDRRVALKVLPKAMAADTKTILRFVREAQVAGKLHHPNIVSVYGMGLKEQVPHYAMEFVDGETLAQILGRLKDAEPESETAFGKKDRPGYFERIAESLADVADGLQHAHSLGVIHRDLKPSNLILDREGRLRILDFGLARLEGQESLTGSGDLMGTVLYMSPEQARARKDPIDRRTDIYSLGATLYEVLAASPPFQGRTPADTLTQIIHRDPRSPRQLNPHVPRDLETIVLKCLGKEPAERYGTAEALAQDLRRFARGDAVEARPQSLGEKFARRIRRNKGKVAAALAVLAVLVYIASLFRDRAAELHRRHVAEYDTAIVDALVGLQTGGALAEQAERFVWSGIGFDLSLVTEDLGFGQVDRIRAAIRTLERSCAAVPERPEAYYLLARGLLLLGDEERAIRELSCAVERGFAPAMFLKATLHERRGEPALARGLLARARESGEGSSAEKFHAAQMALAEGRWKEAAEAYGELMELEKADRSPYLGAAVEIYLGCAIAQMELAEFDKARQNFVVAGALRPESVEPELFLGAACYAQGARKEAEAVFDRLFRRRPTAEVAHMIVGMHSIYFNDPETALAWVDRMPPCHGKEVWRTFVLMQSNRRAEATEAARNLVEAYPEYALSYLAAVEATIEGRGAIPEKELEEAEAWGRELVRLAPRSGLAYSDQAMLLERRNRPDEALRSWRKAVEVEPGAAKAHFNLGNALLQRGEIDEAACSFRKAGELGRAATGGLLEPGVPQLYHGLCLEDLGKREEALRAFEEGIALAPRVRRFPSGWVATLPLLARAQAATGHAGDAVRTVEQALEHPEMPLWTIRNLEIALEEYAGSASPDLPTYRSIDLALAALDLTVLAEKGAAWKYWKGREAPSPGLEWTRVDFPDASWESGPSGFGYGDGDDATILGDMQNGYSSLYIRHVFEVPHPEAFERLILSVKADDGFVAYLNGKEVARSEVGAEVVVAHDALATRAAFEPLAPVEAFAPSTSLVTGRNVLAVQGLNAGLDSTDFSLIPVLKAEIPWDAARGEKLLGEFRRVAEGPGSEARLAHLDGRLLFRGQERQRAAERFALAVVRDPTRPEPLLTLADSLRLLGRPAEAERLLRDALEERTDVRDVWDAWAAVSFADLGRSPHDLLADLPRRDAAAKQDSSSYRQDLRWLLERLERGEPIRINCGGERYESPGGIVWDRDRFFRSGDRYMRGQASFTGEIENTDDDPLYRTERYFVPLRLSSTGYRIPLPKGTYRVALHFAEIAYERPGRRVFDVLSRATASSRITNPRPRDLPPRSRRPARSRSPTASSTSDFVPGSNTPRSRRSRSSAPVGESTPEGLRESDRAGSERQSGR